MNKPKGKRADRRTEREDRRELTEGPKGKGQKKKRGRKEAEKMKAVSRHTAPQARSIFSQPENSKQVAFAISQQQQQQPVGRQRGQQQRQQQQPLQPQRGFQSTFGGNQEPGQTFVSNQNTRVVRAAPDNMRSQVTNMKSVNNMRKAGAGGLQQQQPQQRRGGVMAAPKGKNNNNTAIRASNGSMIQGIPYRPQRALNTNAVGAGGQQQQVTTVTKSGRPIRSMSMRELNDFVRRQGGRSFMDEDDDGNAGFNQSLSFSGAAMNRKNGSLPPEIQQMSIPFVPSKRAATQRQLAAQQQQQQQAAAAAQKQQRPKSWYDSKAAQMISSVVQQERAEAASLTSRKREEAAMAEALSMGRQFVPSTQQKQPYQQHQLQQQTQTQTQKKAVAKKETEVFQQLQQVPPMTKPPTIRKPQQVQKQQPVQQPRQQRQKKSSSPPPPQMQPRQQQQRRYESLAAAGERSGDDLEQQQYRSSQFFQGEVVGETVVQRGLQRDDQGTEAAEQPSDLFAPNVLDIQYVQSQRTAVVPEGEEEEFPTMPVSTASRRRHVVKPSTEFISSTTAAFDPIAMEKNRVAQLRTGGGVVRDEEAEEDDDVEDKRRVRFADQVVPVS